MHNNASNLIKKIKSKDAQVGIIGLGYVGLPLALCFSEKKFNTTGFDIDQSKANVIKKGKSYIKHIPDSRIKKCLKNGFKITSTFEKISVMDVIIICVPTPLGIHNEPDLKYIHSTLSSISDYIRENQIIILESTTYPGTTEDEIAPFINKTTKLKIGKNFFIGYSPEREDPGNKQYNTKNIPKVVSGFTKSCLSITSEIYQQIINETVAVSSPRVAEMTKILENIHRAVNIGLVNEMKIVADKMNIDIYEVIEAASTKPFGFTPYYPGPGLGGHCIPIDPFYLTWKAKEVGMNTRFIELAGEINSSMPKYVINKISEALNLHHKSISKSKIMVLGLSYKKNIDDLRESPSLEMIDILIGKGALVSYCDPFFKNIPITRKHDFKIPKCELTKKNLNNTDLVLIATDHDTFDYDLIEKESPLIIDTRGRLNKSNKVFKA